MNWPKGLAGEIRKSESLKKHTTFKIGGRANFFISPNNERDLEYIVKQAKINKIKIRVIGSGSNILVSDKGVDCAVIALNSSYFKKIVFKGNKLYVGAGALLGRIVLSSRKKNLSGLEFLTGIPGTVGGALVMNAGAQNKKIGDLVESILVMDTNCRLKTLGKEALSFGYRKSSLKNYIVLGVTLKLLKAAPDKIARRIREYLKYRNFSQEYRAPSAGCIFKNPIADSAGRLIDACGLKGKKSGGAQVSLKHANFIINTGKAKAKDVERLMEMIKKQVKKKFNINLEPEIKIWK
ncbi:MAG: UDP-N-acetylmuramate dehydrogenase [Candidatus Omnitrophota bacterium]